MKKLFIGTFSIFILMFPVLAEELKCSKAIQKYKDKLDIVEKAGKINFYEKNGYINLYTKYVPYENYNRETLNFLKECMYEVFSKINCEGQKKLKKVVIKDKSKLFSDMFKLKTVAICEYKFAKER